MVRLRRAADFRERLERQICLRVAADRPVLATTTGVTSEADDSDDDQSEDEEDRDDESRQNDQAAGVC